MIDFPPEILHEIGISITDKRDVLHMRLASRQYAAIFTPYAVPAFNLRVGTKLMGCNDKDTGRMGFERNLREYSSAPIPDAFIRHITSLGVSVELHLGSFSFKPPHPMVWELLPRFTGVKRLWVSFLSMDRYDSCRHVEVKPVLDRLFDIIVDATDACLTHVELDLTRPREVTALPDSFIRLRNLETFIVDRDCDAQSSPTSQPKRPCVSLPSIATQLGSITRHNPALRNLRYRYSCPDPGISIHHILPHDANTTNLERLTIQGLFIPTPTSPEVKIPPLPNLRNLQHLELTGERAGPPANIDRFWNALRSAGAALKALATCHVSAALIDYLGTFRGLQNCDLDLPEVIRPGVSVSSFLHACTAHAATLETLLIGAGRQYDTLPPGTEGFAFSHHTLIEPASFRRLRHLMIPCAPNLDLTPANYDALCKFLSRFPALGYVQLRWFGTRGHETDGFPNYFYTKTGKPDTLIIQHYSEFCSRGRMIKTK